MVPSGRLNAPSLRWRSVVMTAYPCAGPADSTDSSSRSRLPFSRSRSMPRKAMPSVTRCQAGGWGVPSAGRRRRGWALRAYRAGCLGGLDGGGEGVDVVAAVVAAAVDEECRGARHAAEVGRVHVRSDAGGSGAAGEVGAEPLGVQAGLGGVAEQVGQEQGVLAAQQEVVHGPEGALVGGGLGGLGGGLGGGGHVGERQV